MAYAKSYLALGDSYTIGEAVAETESFPFQLVELLRNDGMLFAAPQIVAKTGWTTDELMAAIHAQAISSSFDLVTLLIGVNNQYRGYTEENYRQEFIKLLNQAISFAGGDKTKVYVLSIPDWGFTEFAQQSGRDLAAISREIDAFNQISYEETSALGISYINITPISRTALQFPALMASDGLHPSGQMYAAWVGLLGAAILAKNKH